MASPARQAPAPPALFCKNSRREKPVLVITSTPSARYTASVSAPVHCGATRRMSERKRKQSISEIGFIRSSFTQLRRACQGCSLPRTILTVFLQRVLSSRQLESPGKWNSRPNALPQCFCIRRGRSFPDYEFGRHGQLHPPVFKSLHSLPDDTLRP